MDQTRTMNELQELIRRARVIGEEIDRLKADRDELIKKMDGVTER